MKSIVKNSFYQLITIYSILILVMYFGLISKYSLRFQIFSLIIAVIGALTLSNKEEPSKLNKVHKILFILAIFLIIIFRIIPYFGNNVLIGYDAPIYKYALEYGLERNDSWIVTGPTMEPAFLYLMKPFSLVFSSEFILKYIFILSIIFLGLAIYLCSNLYFGKTSAIISLLFYSLSVTQFFTFELLYFRNVIGLALMLFSLFCLKKYEIQNKEPYLYSFLILGGLLGAIHRPTFYIFGLSYFFYTFRIAFKSRDIKKYFTYVLYGIILLLIPLVFYIGRFWPAITSIIAPVANSFTESGESPGTFISLSEYQFVSLAYLPLALLGIFYLFRKKQFNFLLIWVIINSAIVYFQFFFFNRFIIHLDIAMLIFAGFGASLAIKERKWLGIAVVVILLIASTYSIAEESLNARNQPINEQDVSFIENLNKITESNAIIMSFSSEYSPWLLAYSNRTIIAPGLFDENKWNLSEWQEFWKDESGNVTQELMSRYDLSRPIYLYTGTKSFNNPCFTEFTEQNGRKVYEYNC